MLKILIMFLMISVTFSNEVLAVSEPEAPSELTIEDNQNDNGHWIIVKYKPGSGFHHLYRYASLGSGTDSVWVYTYSIPGGFIDEEGFSAALVSTPVNDDYFWALITSNSEIPETLESLDDFSVSNIYLGGAIDNISPNPFISFNIQLKENYKDEVILNWEVPDDHGVVGNYGLGIGQFPIYGVEKYEIYRKHNDDGNFLLLGDVDRMSLSYTDSNIDKYGVYEYYVKAVDGNPEHNTITNTQSIYKLLPPPNFIVEDVPNDHGHGLKLRWNLSPDDEKGYVSFYRIYRSRSDELTEPITLRQFSSIDTLMVWEEHYTILIDSVTAGITEYIDDCVPVNGVLYYYWLQAVGTNVVSEKIAANAANIVVSVDEKPTTFVLHPAYPNPFNPATTIQFEVNGKSHIRLVIYDILGREIIVIHDGLLSAGLHEVVWNGKNEYGTAVGSGVYLYCLKADNSMKQGKMLLMK